MPEPYHTPTSEDYKNVDQRIDQMTEAFVWNKNHLTPAVEAQLEAAYPEVDKASVDELIAKHAEHEDEWLVEPRIAPDFGEK